MCGKHILLHAAGCGQGQLHHGLGLSWKQRMEKHGPKLTRSMASPTKPNAVERAWHATRPSTSSVEGEMCEMQRKLTGLFLAFRPSEKRCAGFCFSTLRFFSALICFECGTVSGSCRTMWYTGISCISSGTSTTFCRYRLNFAYMHRLKRKLAC